MVPLHQLPLILQKHWYRVLVHCDKADRNRRGEGRGRRGKPATNPGTHLQSHTGAYEGSPAGFRHVYKSLRLIKLIFSVSRDWQTSSFLLVSTCKMREGNGGGRERIKKRDEGWGRKEKESGREEKTVCGCFPRPLELMREERRSWGLRKGKTAGDEGPVSMGGVKKNKPYLQFF